MWEFVDYVEQPRRSHRIRVNFRASSAARILAESRGQVMLWQLSTHITSHRDGDIIYVQQHVAGSRFSWNTAYSLEEAREVVRQ